MDFNKLINSAITERIKRKKLLKKKKELHEQSKKIKKELDDVNQILHDLEGMIPEWQISLYRFIEEKAKEAE